MDNYDVAPLNSRTIRLGPGIAESAVDGMTINPVGPLAAGRSAEGSYSRIKDIYFLSEVWFMQIALWKIQTAEVS